MQVLFVHAHVQVLEKLGSRDLLRSRKLILIVDLDHTLVHTDRIRSFIKPAIPVRLIIIACMVIKYYGRLNMHKLECWL